MSRLGFGLCMVSIVLGGCSTGLPPWAPVDQLWRQSDIEVTSLFGFRTVTDTTLVDTLSEHDQMMGPYHNSSLYKQSPFHVYRFRAEGGEDISIELDFSIGPGTRPGLYLQGPEERGEPIEGHLYYRNPIVALDQSQGTASIETTLFEPGLYYISVTKAQAVFGGGGDHYAPYELRIDVRRWDDQRQTRDAPVGTPSVSMRR